MKSIDFSQKNKLLFSSNESWQKVLNEFEGARIFIDDFSTLTVGRDMQIIRSEDGIKQIWPNKILLSATQTVKSIILCLTYGNIADANILLRKLRDDLFFYLYIIVTCNNENLLSSKDLSRQENFVNAWLNNELSHLNISEVIKNITKTDECIDLVTSFNLDNELHTIGKTLNNYTHGNGRIFYNRPYNHYQEDELDHLGTQIVHTLNYILVSFIFLLILLCPSYISSTDYIDFLEFGMTPIEDSQYWVAPFIKDFVEKHNYLLGDNSLQFLRSRTQMDI